MVKCQILVTFIQDQILFYWKESFSDKLNLCFKYQM